MCCAGLHRQANAADTEQKGQEGRARHLQVCAHLHGRQVQQDQAHTRRHCPRNWSFRSSFSSIFTPHAVSKCWSSKGLRDEIFVQLCKQTTSNTITSALLLIHHTLIPRSLSCLKGWELMWICLNFFPPSSKFFSYVQGGAVHHICHPLSGRRVHQPPLPGQPARGHHPIRQPVCAQARADQSVRRPPRPATTCH